MGSYDWGEIAKSAPKGFEPVKAGSYTVEVTGADPKVYSSGNHGVDLELTIEDVGPEKGKKIKFVTIVFMKDNPNVFLTQMRTLGVSIEFFNEFDIGPTSSDEDFVELMEEIADEVIGLRAIAPVTQQKYEGKVNNKVGFFKPVGSEKTGRKRRSSTPDVGEDEPAAAVAPAAEDEPAPRRTRARRSSKGEPGLPPGL